MRLSFCPTKHANLSSFGWLAVRYNAEQWLAVSSSHIVPQATLLYFLIHPPSNWFSQRMLNWHIFLSGMLTPLKFIILDCFVSDQNLYPETDLCRCCRSTALSWRRRTPRRRTPSTRRGRESRAGRRGWRTPGPKGTRARMLEEGKENECETIIAINGQRIKQKGENDRDMGIKMLGYGNKKSWYVGIKKDLKIYHLKKKSII